MFVVDIKLKNNKGVLNNCKVYNGTGKTNKVLTFGDDISLRMCDPKYEFIHINNGIIKSDILIDDIDDYMIHELK